MSLSAFSLSAVAALMLCFFACESTGGSGASMGSGPSESQRAVQIAAEAPGNHWVGRRYVVDRCHLWGYVRRPRQPWSSSKLVILDERVRMAPDRLPEEGPEGARFGFDQNYEYKLTGDLTGEKTYDPNSNLILPNFRLTGYELINKDPGWLFKRGERYTATRLLREEPGASMW